MATFSELSSALSETLTSVDLQGVPAGLADTFADTLFEDGLAKDIPIIGTIYALGKFGVSVSDRLFLKKLLSFIPEVADVPAEDRAEVISRIDASGKYQIKVGEKLLYILDKSEDHENSRIVAYLFRAFLSGELSYDEFLRASRASQSMMVADLWRFVEDEEERWDGSEAGDLLNTGLVTFDESAISVVDEDDWKVGAKYRVEDGSLTVSITPLGEKVRRVLRSRRAAMERNDA